MAVHGQIPQKEYIANGETKLFPLTFSCDDQKHLIVTVNDAELNVGSWLLTENAVNFNTAPANGSKVIIQRHTPLERTTQYKTYNNSFRPEPIDKDFDRIWWKLQELGYADTILFVKLTQEVSNRIYGDKSLQTEIDFLSEQIELSAKGIINNKSLLNNLIANLSQEVSDRIQGDIVLRNMFLQLMNEAITEGSINVLAITTIESVEDLADIKAWHGRTVFVKSRNRPVVGRLKPYSGGGHFVFDSTKKGINDSGVCINGWVRQLDNNVLTPQMFGAEGDLLLNLHEVLTVDSATDDTKAFKNMLNMNKYVVCTNISKAIPSQKYCKYTFLIPHAGYLISDTLPIRSFTKISGSNSTLYFNPTSSIDMFSTPRNEMAEAFKINTGWNTQTISMVDIQDLVIIGNLTRTSKVHAQKCFDGANPYKWKLTNLLIERFQNGITFYPLDTSSWTNGSRIGNFYENILDGVTINECVQGLFNAGNATQATNLTIGGGYIISGEFFNKFDYLLINHGSGFSCNGFNIGPAWSEKTDKPLIYDACNGSYYSGGYTEWFQPLFELGMPDRFGGFKLDASHLFKYTNHCLIKFREGVFSKYDYAKKTRSVPNKFKDGRKWNQYLNSTGYGVGTGGELITSFFKYCPQYDFKYGLYGISNVSEDLIYDVKRFEKENTGFTSKYGIRLINGSKNEINLNLPINNQPVMSKVCILYRNIKNFNQDDFKSNVLDFGGMNGRISTGDLMVDYGNGWKLAVLETTSENYFEGNITITLRPNSQVEIEHIGAYANGWSFMPSYHNYEPLINSIDHDSVVGDMSGATLKAGDISRAITNITIGGGFAGDISDKVFNAAGVYSSRYTIQGNLSINSSDKYIDLTRVSSSASCVGVGFMLNIQQASKMGLHQIVGREYENNEFVKKLYLKTIDGQDIVSGTVTFFKNYLKKATSADLNYFKNKYITRSIPYGGVVVAHNTTLFTDFELNGAQMGDSIICSCSPSIGISSIIWSEVVSQNKVRVYHRNLTSVDFKTDQSTVLKIKSI